MLIIVESPAKAKTISKILGSKYSVVASVGHIRRITDDSKTKDGRKLEINGIDIENGFTPLYEVDAKKKDVVSNIKSLAKKADQIMFATDSDREGEAISWHLAQILGVKDMKGVKRMEFHEITTKAIQHALDNPRPLNVELVEAQKARQVLDKLVGYKLSPVLWSALSNYKLSAGRVQSPALRLICEREKEIMAFIPEEYWTIKGSFEKKYDSNFTKFLTTKEERQEFNKTTEEDYLTLELKESKGNKLPEKISSKKETESIIESITANTDFTITSIKQSEEKTSPRAPFITSTLQQTASSRLGFGPKITMQLAQRLYEGIEIDGSPVALITYMRTDSTTLSKDSLDSIRALISKKFPQFLPASPRIYKSKSKNAQEAHEAIRPTDISRTPESLKGKIDPKQLKLYELIWRNTVASQMMDEKKNRVTFNLLNTPKDMFSGSVAWTIFQGYKAIWGDIGEDLSYMADKFKEGQKLDLQNLFCIQNQTTPPSRYSPASLIKKLEDLGIGRPSTYASIITTLYDRLYAIDAKNSIQPTTLGMKVSDILTENFSKITGSSMTAEMEENLDKVSLGEKTYLELLSEFWTGFKSEVESKQIGIKENSTQYRTSETDQKCFSCGAAMTQKLGRFGEYYQCGDVKEHMFPINYLEYKHALEEAQTKFNTQTEGQKCKECKKDLIVRVSKAALKAYIACPDYRVGNNHTVTDITFGKCPKCATEGRTGKKQGSLVLKTSRKLKKEFLSCNLPIKECGYIAKDSKDAEKKEEE
jgi:DNA topoisomerase I